MCVAKDSEAWRILYIVCDPCLARVARNKDSEDKIKVKDYVNTVIVIREEKRGTRIARKTRQFNTE